MWDFFDTFSHRAELLMRRHRVAPRIVLFGYGVWCVWIGEWFLGLDDPTSTQSAFAMGVVGGMAAITTFYQNSGGEV